MVFSEGVCRVEPGLREEVVKGDHIMIKLPFNVPVSHITGSIYTHMFMQLST